MLHLPETLTQTTARRCAQELSQALQAEPQAIVVDASRLRAFDSTALAVLLALRREAARLGKSFALAGLPQRLGDLARLYGIAELLPEQA